MIKNRCQVRKNEHFYFCEMLKEKCNLQPNEFMNNFLLLFTISFQHSTRVYIDSMLLLNIETCIDHLMVKKNSIVNDEFPSPVIHKHT